jgi:hypothetical protein
LKDAGGLGVGTYLGDTCEAEDNGGKGELHGLTRVFSQGGGCMDDEIKRSLLARHSSRGEESFIDLLCNPRTNIILSTSYFVCELPKTDVRNSLWSCSS